MTFAGQCTKCSAFPCNRMGPCAPPPPEPPRPPPPPPPPLWSSDGCYRVTRAFKFRNKVRMTGSILPACAEDDAELLDALESRVIEPASWHIPPPPPPAPPPSGLFIVTATGGIFLGHSNAIAGPGTLVWLTGSAAQRLGESVRRLDLDEILAAKSAVTTKDRT